MNDILQEVVDSHRDTDILEFLTEKGIAWRSFTGDVLMDLHMMTNEVPMSVKDRKFIDLRIAFLVRYIKDLEFKATA